MDRIGFFLLIILLFICLIWSAFESSRYLPINLKFSFALMGRNVLDFGLTDSVSFDSFGGHCLSCPDCRGSQKVSWL